MSFTQSSISTPPAAEVTVQVEGRSVNIPTQLYINGQVEGEWVEGHGAPLESYNPATEELIASVHTADENDIELAVKAARQAFETTWGLNVAGAERGRLLYKFADIIEANLDTVVALEAADGGKPYQWAKGDLNAALAAIRYYAGMADKIQGSTCDVGDSSKSVTVRKEPIGVVAQIVPWNFPVMMWAWKIAPALAAGCAIIFKPAENTPLAALYLTKLMEQVGWPKGVFNLLNGTGKVVGEPLALHMDIDKIAFTGSTAVGRHISTCAAKSNLKRVTLELGGKSPNIVFPSANLKEAAKWAAFGLFETTGQSCIVGSRILVHESIHNEFVTEFVEVVKQIRVGKDPKAFYGSLISKVQFDKVLNYIEIGKKEAKLETGGARHGDKGYFVQPTVFSNVNMTHQIAREEIFGPVASVIKFKDEEEAISIANNTTYGLAAAVHTLDANQMPRVTRKLRAGTVWVNQYSVLHPNVPFGGMRQSGVGRELGPNGIENYLETKAVHHYYGPPLNWPFEL